MFIAIAFVAGLVIGSFFPDKIQSLYNKVIDQWRKISKKDDEF